MRKIFKYQESNMNRKLSNQLISFVFAAAFIVGSVVALAEEPAAAEAKKPTYVGSKACKTCHQGEKNGKIFEQWSESKHANAMARLDSAKGETKDPKCLKCHTVGYGAGGFGEAGKEALDLAGVGCESCHGPGSEYKAMKVMKDHDASIAAGLWVPEEKTCTACHNAESPTFKGFNFKEAYAKIEHHVPPKADSTATPPK
jgi:cytochrome c2